MTRRGHREGSIYRRKDGRWAASISMEGRKRKTYYGKTRKDVQEKLKVALHEQQQGTLTTGPQQPLKFYMDHWLEETHRFKIRTSTYVGYRLMLNKHILPALGHVPLQKLTPQQVQALYAQKMKDGLTPGSVRNIHTVLHKALENAVRWGLVARNVCDAVSPPRTAKREIQPLTREQAQQLLEAARGHRLEVLLLLAIATGARRGELIGLRWSDVSFEEGCIHIRRTVSRVTGFGLVESEPKTTKGQRKIILPQFALDALKQQHVQQAEDRLKAGAAWKDKGLVFSNPLGDFIDPNSIPQKFYTLLAEIGLPRLHFHDLRHSTASILLSMGVHPKIVQEILGHSTMSITVDIYSHSLPSMQREAMQKLNDLFQDHRNQDEITCIDQK